MSNSTDAGTKCAGNAVGRTLAVLRAMRQQGPGEHTLAVVASAAGLPAPTAHRYLQALVREGVVEHGAMRGCYALAEPPPHSPRPLPASPSVTGSGCMPSVLPELTTLQSRSDQIALLYVPNLVGHPVRICTHWAVGAHGAELRTSPEAALRHLWCAPLGADAAGLAMLAYLGETSAVPGLEQIRRRGHAVSRTPFAQRDAIAAPFWCGSAVGGAVTLLVTRRHMAMPAKRRFYVDAVTHAAGLLSRRFQRTAQALGPADARASLPGDAGPERLPRIS